MPATPFFSAGRLPAPVLAAAIAILLTRLFNLLMFVFQPDGAQHGELLPQLSLLPGYLLLFSLVLVVYLSEIATAVALLAGKPGGRKMFIGCQGLLLLLVIVICWPGDGALPGIDMEDAQQLGRHLLLQKIPDVLILLMLYIPASSHGFFKGHNLAGRTD